MTRGLFRVEVDPGTVRLARGDTDDGPHELLEPGLTLAGLLATGDGLGTAIASAPGVGSARGLQVLAPVDVAGGLGGGRHVPALARRPDGGVDRADGLRPRLRRRPARAVLQVERRGASRGPGESDRRSGADSGLERAGARAGAGRRRGRDDRRVHDRQRHARRGRSRARTRCTCPRRRSTTVPARSGPRSWRLPTSVRRSGSV